MIYINYMERNMRVFPVALRDIVAYSGIAVLAGLAALTIAPKESSATLNVTDNGTTLTTTWDETFTLIRDMDLGGFFHAIVFDAMFADPFTAAAANPQNEIYDMRASVNGGPDIVLAPWSGWNYRIGHDAPNGGWLPEDKLGLAWDPHTLGGAVAGDTVRLFGSMTHDKGGFHHLPDFAPTTVSFSAYSAPPFSGVQPVSDIPLPLGVVLLGSGILALGFTGMRRRNTAAG